MHGEVLAAVVSVQGGRRARRRQDQHALHASRHAPFVPNVNKALEENVVLLLRVNFFLFRQRVRRSWHSIHTAHASGSMGRMGTPSPLHIWPCQARFPHFLDGGLNARRPPRQSADLQEVEEVQLVACLHTSV